jgi:hypothetical protein
MIWLFGGNELSTQKKEMKKVKNQRQNERYKTGSFLTTIILGMVIGIVPLILYFKKVVFNDPGHMYKDGLSSHLDVYSYYKMAFLLLATVIGLIIFLYFRHWNILEKEKNKYYILMGIYSVLVTLSALLSEFKPVAFLGFLNRYEGALVILAYIVLLFLAMNIIQDDKTLKLLFTFLLGSACIISIIGVLQIFGIDYYNSKMFLDLITPNFLQNRIGEIKVNFPPHTVISTLANSNYVGSYMAMLLPINLLLIVYAKRILHKGLLLIPFIMIILNWIGCQSRAGIVGGFLSLFIVLFILRRELLKYKFFVLAGILALIISLPIVNIVTKGQLFGKVVSMISLEGKNESGSGNSIEKMLQGLNDIKIDSKVASLVTKNGTVEFSLPDGQLCIRDEKNTDIDFKSDGSIVQLIDERFRNIRLNTNPDAGLIEVYYNNFKIVNIILTETGLRSDSNYWMTLRGNREIETLGFKGYESLGSNRGYIWSRTIPLLKNTILIGHGPDTFPMYFPQYDFIGKLKAYQTGAIFIDKPHNLYLQTAVNTGVLSLIAMISLFGIYFVSSLRLYLRQNFTTFLPIAGAACFAAFSGYIVAGLFNDSVVWVAPVFWVLLGTGIGINTTLKKNIFEKKPTKASHKLIL